MSNTLTKVEFSRLPEYTSQAKFLQLQIENWQKAYAEAGSQKETAWRLYGEAIEEEMPQDEIEQLFILAEMFDEICREAWGELEKAKRDYLLLLN
jgi:hypothetical protein